MIGSLLLALPISSRSGEWTPYIDALFTSTSATCVTGLTTVNTLEHWSFFGQFIIMLLIQLGGLGIVTFTTIVLMVMGRRITLKERLLIQNAYNLDTLQGLVKMTIRIVEGTLLIEGIGACLYAIQYIPDYGVLQGIWKSVFNSVSAFCNAGMDLIGDYSLTPYRNNILINLVTMALIIIGGIGFPVWWDVLRVWHLRRKEKLKFRKCLSKFSLHSKLVISVTFLLIVGGALFIFLLEFNNPKTIGEMPVWEKVLASLFQSVTTRTAGFLTIPQEGLHETTSFVCIVLMFIGGSPSGTAGGVKTVTIAMMLLAVISTIKGNEDTEVFHRKITNTLVKKGMAVVLINMAVLIVMTIALSAIEGKDFLNILYETTSALGTVGLTRNLTGNLTIIGRIIIIITMYIGRVGPITLALFFNRKHYGTPARSLPPEKILVG
ncbi:potassium transporter KtrB [Lachnospiraceae bacterium WCA-693-APC-MOT-I]|uniref:Potassium transporter KtrB n=2 Tax=Velocimicrobium porci TaxID=2606634 RepID=A0A6L5Y0X7_9FIRM|nr:potassium transporter KtrB [Velocimicrobium porci]